jgi:hypothetical protein
MQKATMAPAVIVLAALCSSLAQAQKVKLDYDKDADFSQYKTYAWLDGTPARQKLWHLHIVGSIDQYLRAKGLRQVEPEAADLLIAYHVAVDAELNVADLYNPTPYYTGGVPTGPFYYSANSLSGSVGRYVRKGTMLVDMVDREKKGVVWRALTSVTLKDTNSKRLEQVNKAVGKVFEKYPPREKN